MPYYMCWTAVMPPTSVVLHQLIKNETLLCNLQQLESAS